MSQSEDETSLARVISLPLLVLYGLGVTIGAGIYVLVGQTAAQTGIYAPMSFIFAALVMALQRRKLCRTQCSVPAKRRRGDLC
ncbi:MAG: hypothetical protein AAED33_06210 [Paracoccaceae bacterium]|jgi:amino acid transporter